MSRMSRPIMGSMGGVARLAAIAVENAEQMESSFDAVNRYVQMYQSLCVASLIAMIESSYLQQIFQYNGEGVGLAQLTLLMKETSLLKIRWKQPYLHYGKLYGCVYSRPQLSYKLLFLDFSKAE